MVTYGTANRREAAAARPALATATPQHRLLHPDSVPRGGIDDDIARVLAEAETEHGRQAEMHRCACAKHTANPQSESALPMRSLPPRGCEERVCR